MDRIEYQVIRSLSKSSLSLWQIINAQDGDIRSTIAVLKRLKERGFIDSDGYNITLTSSGRDFVLSYMKEFVDSKCPRCFGTGLIINERFKKTLEDFEKIFEGRPLESAEFDQGVVPAENSVRRVEFIYKRGDLEGKSILFLGDDDLTSVAMAMTELPGEIVVIEIDERVVNYINEVSRKLGLNLQAYIYNAVNPLPEELKGRFDTFLNDPVETVKGIRVFLSRCVAALKGEGSAGYFGLSHYESSLKKWIQVEKDLLSMNLVITDVLRDFNVYLLTGERILKEGFRVVVESPFKPTAPDYPWYRSTFFRVEVVGCPNPLVTETVEWNRDIYFDEDTYVALP